MLFLSDCIISSQLNTHTTHLPVELRAKNTVKAEVKAKHPPEVIELSSDIDSSEEVQVLSEPGPLRNTVKQSIGKHTLQSASIRLNTKKSTKPGKSSGLSNQTKEYLSKKKKLFDVAADPKQNAPVTIRCELFLQSDTGRKTGTRVPMQSRAFQQSEVCWIVESEHTESTNIWHHRYSTLSFSNLSRCSANRMACGAKFSRDVPSKGQSNITMILMKRSNQDHLSSCSAGDRAVNFTFKNDSDIPIKWRSLTVGEFWSKTEAAGIYLKPADIKHKTLTLAILVPLPAVSVIRLFRSLVLMSLIHIQSSDSEYEAASVSSSAKRKRRKSSPRMSASVVKREKLEFEDFKDNIIAKTEPTELQMKGTTKLYSKGDILIFFTNRCDHSIPCQS